MTTKWENIVKSISEIISQNLTPNDITDIKVAFGLFYADNDLVPNETKEQDNE